jgi:hypothetical protein
MVRPQSCKLGGSIWPSLEMHCAAMILPSSRQNLSKSGETHGGHDWACLEIYSVAVGDLVTINTWWMSMDGSPGADSILQLVNFHSWQCYMVTSRSELHCSQIGSVGCKYSPAVN